MKIKCTLMGLLVAGVCLIVGCGTPRVPKTDLSVKTEKWNMRLKSSKDTDLGKLNVNLETNGTVSVALDHFTATNSPVVIRETGKAQAATIDAQGRIVTASGEVVGQVVNGVVQLYGK